ncbi:hypothetical protein NQZ79_g3824 [Umbelopsis isabellina]|nr:hypothetical protein NQZ79_g3824 [Umbelopsis isabellina]
MFGTFSNKRILAISGRIATRCRTLSTVSRPRNAWLLTDGSLEAHKQCTSLADHINVHYRTLQIKPNAVFQGLPVILQKLLIDTFPGSGKQGKLPSYLSSNEESVNEPYPSFLITSGRNAIAGSLFIKSQDRKNILSKSVISVYLGFPDIPFGNFDHVILPKYEVATKLAKLGPLSNQKNYTSIMTPLMNLHHQPEEVTSKALLSFSSPAFVESDLPLTAFVVGNHNHHCRWYPEDASLVADNIERIIKNLDQKVLLIYTDKTAPKIKETIRASLKAHESDSPFLATCDLSKIENVEEKCRTYDALLQQCERAVLTADLDYLVMEAVVKRKPVYIAFQDRCSGHLLQIHRWLRESSLTRKLRLNRMRSGLQTESSDPFSYLGNHKPWGDGRKALDLESVWRKVVDTLESLEE